LAGRVEGHRRMSAAETIAELRALCPPRPEEDADILDLCRKIDELRPQARAAADISGDLLPRDPGYREANARTDILWDRLDKMQVRLATMRPATQVGLAAMARQALLCLPHWDDGTLAVDDTADQRLALAIFRHLSGEEAPARLR